MFGVDKKTLMDIVEAYSERILAEDLDRLEKLIHNEKVGVDSLESSLVTNFKDGLLFDNE